MTEMAVQQMFGLTDLVSLLASVASLILAIIAIWLSVKFFQMSAAIAERASEAAKDLAGSVERIEKLFDRLYSDTFTMMKDTVSDMRQHMWPKTEQGADDLAAQAEKTASEKIDILRGEISGELGDMLRKQKGTDAQIRELRSEMTTLIDRAINQSRHVESEARRETLRAALLRTLEQFNLTQSVIRAEQVVERLSSEAPPSRIVDELKNLQNEGYIWTDTGVHIGAGTRIRLRTPRDHSAH